MDADTNGDGLNDAREIKLETDPQQPDSDNNGVPDGAEVTQYSSDPLTAGTDGDDLADGAEINSHETDPTAPDTDGDSLTDGTEVNEHGTDPAATDTDGDVLSDSREVSGVTGPAQSDTDDDGLSDQIEVEQLANGPVTADTDGDGLEDGREYNTLDSSPTTVDTDGGTLSDGDEVRQYETDPTEADTDGDGLRDDREVSNAALSAVQADTDNDQADDGTELRVGTEPDQRDTDGDGFLDGVELSNHQYMDDADPIRKDIFVEVDYAAPELRPTQTSLGRLRDAFQDASVSNPNGERGIELHIFGDGSAETAVPASLSLEEYESGPYRNRDIRASSGYGFYHLLVAESVDGTNQDVAGITNFRINGMLVAKQDSPRTGTTMLHELGHQLGLSSGSDAGTDSQQVQWESYPSVMNYNMPLSCNSSWFGLRQTCSYERPFTYSSDTGFDDWSYIADHLAENQPNTTTLRAETS